LTFEYVAWLTYKTSEN